MGACGEKAWPRLDQGVDKREDGGAQKVAEGGVEGLHVPQRKRGLEVQPERDPRNVEGCSEDHHTSHDEARVAERDAERVPRAPRRTRGPGDEQGEDG